MVFNSISTGENLPLKTTDNDRKTQRKAFDDTKTGVKGLVDSGITKIPKIFIHPPENTLENNNIKKNNSNNKDTNFTDQHFKIPLIDLCGVDDDPKRRKEIVGEILEASQTWGFFQVVNHGIPTSILEEMLGGVRRFHEEDDEVKKRYYTRDCTKKMVYNSNFDLYSSKAASWRDSINCIMAPEPPKPEELPSACREILMTYSSQVMGLGISLFKLLSEALGLNPDHLIDINCAQTLTLFGHYYPACPEPELTLGTARHSDYCFLTILLQDNLGGLQVLNQDQWVDVPPSSGALVVNIGDLMQLISNDKLRSVEHRVLVSHSPRTSVAGFFGRDISKVSTSAYGPIQHLLSEDNPPKYRATTIVRPMGVDGTSALESLRL